MSLISIDSSIYSYVTNSYLRNVVQCNGKGKVKTNTNSLLKEDTIIFTLFF